MAPAGRTDPGARRLPPGRRAGRPHAGHPRPPGLSRSPAGRATASSTGVGPPTSSSTAPSRRRRSGRRSTAATSSRGTLPGSTAVPSVTRPVPGSSVRPPGRSDRRVAAPDRARTSSSAAQLGPQVDDEDLVHALGGGPVGDGLDAHRGDQQVRPHPGPLGRVGEQDGGRRGRRCPCGRPRCPAPRRRRRRRRRRRPTAAATSSTDADSRSRTAGSTPSAAQVGLVLGVADDADDGVAAGGQQTAEAAGDLPVGPGDDDAHGPWRPTSADGAAAAPAVSRARGGLESGVRPGAVRGRAGRDGRRPAPARRSAGVSQSARARAPGRRRDASGDGDRRSTRRSDVGPCRPAPPRSAAVRQAPSRYWSRPRVVDDEDAVAGEPLRAARATSPRGEERQVPGQHGHDVGATPRRARHGPRRPGHRRAAARAPGRRRPDRLGGPTTIRCVGVGDRVEDGGEHGAPADRELRLGLAAEPGRPARRPGRRPCRAAAGPRRHRRAAWVPSCSWDESPAGHRCCASADRCTPPGPTRSPPRSRWRSGWPARRWR